MGFADVYVEKCLQHNIEPWKHILKDINQANKHQNESSLDNALRLSTEKKSNEDWRVLNLSGQTVPLKVQTIS